MKQLALLFVFSLGLSPILKAQEAVQHVSVLSYNIHHAENNNGVLDLQGIANVILAYNPDIVALQEVDSVATRTKGVDQLKELASLTGMYIYFGKAMDLQGGGYGVGIMSRFPITRSYTLALPAKNPKAEPRAAAIVTLQLPGDSALQFVSTHLDYAKDGVDRTAQMQLILKHFEGNTIPTIIAGDFNTTPASKEMVHWKKTFTDVTEKAGFTHPAEIPSIKIDYIFIGPKARFTIISAKTIEETVASDHRPVFSELEIK
ncbi:endonuclease/exonuclease/phosphatase family metal-dependent hydrolase [Chitinophaga skermanii]|uniref:Endonuclease/exonuclease/phosphatase family metal-dependent hydrolase n=1 Tax=Chitinophaga skermanii TaxID=331697 RepID=A0A327Q6H9_9BACT|nr:endonuclease/exonuclease/phosphatase family protein [Chitinophaga skermanii]RAI99371.1 endonuclease/exonuclease/phosphatase family metal-dependent hydrolase [Chitinophaga skermanii]